MNSDEHNSENENRSLRSASYDAKAQQNHYVKEKWLELGFRVNSYVLLVGIYYQNFQ